MFAVLFQFSNFKLPCGPSPPGQSGPGHRDRSSRHRGRRYPGRPAHSNVRRGGVLSLYILFYFIFKIHFTWISYFSLTSVLNSMMGTQGVMKQL